MSQIITINDVKSKEPCKDGFKYFLEHYPNGFNIADYNKKLWDKIVKTKGLKYIGWFAWKFGLRQFPYPKDLRNADLRCASMHEADLSGVDLRGARLYGASLNFANLYFANLRGANLAWASLINADLSGADLRGADLRFSILSGAKMRGANLGGADLRHCNAIWYWEDCDIQGTLLPLGRSAWHLKE